MTKLVGFRNVSVHEYQSVSHEITMSIVTHLLGGCEAFRGFIARVIDTLPDYNNLRKE